MNDPFDDARALTHHSSALRRLARGLVSDPNTADDLVQDTWLGALTRWRRRGEATGPGGLRLGVRHRAISGRRRRAAEALGDAEALAGDAGEPAEAAARLERYRILHEELTALREPYRRTLVARFVEEERHAAIARAEGIKVDTVRTRITRGLALLRERLDRRFEDGGGRGAWMAALAPLAEPERAAAGLGAGAVLGAAVALVAAGSITALAAIGDTDPPPTPPLASRAVADADAAPAGGGLVAPAEEPSAARASGGAADPAAELPASAAPAAAPTEDAEPLTISGVAVDQDGRPVAGIAFEALRPPWRTLRASPGHKDFTDSAGRFEAVLAEEVKREDLFNVAFAVAPTLQQMERGSWCNYQVGALEHVRAGSSGHVVELRIDRRAQARVVGSAPALEPLFESVRPKPVSIRLMREAGSRESRTVYVVSGLEPGERFAIEGVLPGRYTVLASGTAMRPIVRTGIVASPGETTALAAFRYEDLGDVVFDEVRLVGGDDSTAEPDGIGGWLTSEDGLVIRTYVRFGGDVPLSEYLHELSPGDWTIHWDEPGLAAPPTRLTIDAGRTTRTSLEVRRTRDVEIRVRVPSSGEADSAPWGTITSSVEDESGRTLRREEPLLARRTHSNDGDVERDAEVAVPIGGAVTVILAADTGERAELELSEVALRGAAQPPVVALR